MRMEQFYNISSIYELEGIFYLLTPFLLDNYYSLCTIIIFACVYVCIIIQAKFRPYLYGRTDMVHNSVFYARLGNLKWLYHELSGRSERNAPGIWVAVLPQGAPIWLFGVCFLLQKFILPWSSAYCFECSSYHSTMIQHMCCSCTCWYCSYVI